MPGLLELYLPLLAVFHDHTVPPSELASLLIFAYRTAGPEA